MISFECPSCSKHLSVKVELAGKKGRCPACRKAIVVPGATATISERHRSGDGAPADASRADEPIVAPASTGSAHDPTFIQQADETSRDGRTIPSSSQVLPRAAPAPKTEDLGQLGVYKLLKVLGQGGMGKVYQAQHTKLEKLVALKVLAAGKLEDQGAVLRFEREMKAVGRLDHPHIVRALDAGDVDGTYFLVMEYVEGRDLADVVKKLGPLPLADACELVRQAAIGLQEAHEHGMVHRDIKPSNLMLTKSPRKRSPPVLKVLDLGLALLTEAHSPDGHGLTSTGQVMGTIDYMAPEQGGDSHQVDIRADIYSLGATLFKLLAGRAPYEGGKFDTPIKKLMALATTPTPDIRMLRPDLPPGLVQVVFAMLAKNPDERFATPDQVAEALEPFCDGCNLQVLLKNALDEPITADDLVQAGSGGTSTHAGSSVAMAAAGNLMAGGPSAGVDPLAALAYAETASLPSGAAFGWENPRTRMTRKSAQGLRGFWNALPRAVRITSIAGVGVIALLLGIVLLWPNGANRSKTNDSQPGARALASSKSGDSPGVPKGTGEIPREPVKPSESAPAIDLLALVELPRDALKHELWGEWTRDGHALISPGGGKAGRVLVPYQFPPEYELTAVVERLAGSDGLLFGFVLDGHAAQISFDAFVPRISGISLIDGKFANVNESVFKERLLIDRQLHTIRITAGKRSVRASVDDREVVHWEGDPQRLSRPEPLPDNNQVSFGAAYDQFKFHKLELRPLGDQPDPQRRLAKWLIDNKFAFTADGLESVSLQGKPLPPDPLRLTIVELRDLNDAHARQFADLADPLNSISTLAIMNPAQGFTAAGLEQLCRVKSVSTLYCKLGMLTSKDCAPIGTLPRLTSVNFDGCLGLDDSIVVHLKQCPELGKLYFNACPISDKALEQAAELPRLSLLYVNSDRVTDKCWALLAKSPALESLTVHSQGRLTDELTGRGLSFLRPTRINFLVFDCLNDATIEEAAALPLHTLGATCPRLTDMGLKHLIGAKLKSLNLTGSKVTEAGVKQLAATIPACRIVWDKGTIEPTE